MNEHKKIPQGFAIGMISVLFIGLLQEFAKFDDQLWDVLFIASVGFIFGSFYQAIKDAIDRDIRKDLEIKISKINNN